MGKYHTKDLPYIDPNGKRFTSYSRMCKAYGKKPSDVHKLISSGTSLAIALGIEPEVKEERKPSITVVKHEASTIDKKVGNRSVEITAPNGITYPSIQKMCEAYGIKYTTYKGRIAMGKSLEEALRPMTTEGRGKSKKCVDHKGNEYNSMTEMYKAYGVSKNVFYNRHKILGWSLQESLEGKPNPEGSSSNNKKDSFKNSSCVDHKGNSFNTVSEMCEFWGISYVNFYSRYKVYNWSLKDALTKPIGVKSDTKINSIIIRVFGSVENFKNECIKRRLSVEVAKRRMADGITSHEEIMAPARYGSYGKACEDHTGRRFPTVTAMCYAYGILPDTYYNRLSLGWDLKSALTVKDPEEAKELNKVCRHNDDDFYVPEEVIVDEPVIETSNDATIESIQIEEDLVEKSTIDESIDEPINDEVEEPIVEEEISDVIVDNEINDDDVAIPKEPIPNTTVKYIKPTAMDKFLALIGFMHCMNCEITLDDVRKMLADHDCEEYTYIKGLLE